MEGEEMVTRKTGFSKAEEKKQVEVPKGRKPEPGKLDDLEDAFRDGVWHAPVASEIIVERKMSGKRQRSLCIVKKVEENLVETWDETLDRWFLFNPIDLVKGGVIAKLPRK